MAKVSRKSPTRALADTPTKEKRKTQTGKRAAEVEDQVRQTLLQLMSGSESDSVRVAAAKALMDKMLQSTAEGDDQKRHDEEERRAAIAEARGLLEELAARLSGGDDGAPALAADGAAGADHAAGA